MKHKASIDYHDILMDELSDPVQAVAYLNAALDDGSAEYFLIAIRNVAEAQGGLKKIAAKTKLNHQSLYRMLSKAGNPELKSLEVLLDALGLKLAIEPKARKLALAR